MPEFVSDIFTHFEVAIFKTLNSSSLKINVREGALDDE